MIKASLSTKEHGFDCMLNHMKDEAKRLSTNDWQKIALLNDIVLIAPMLGLLGTVLGMFYAFYDTNRSVERIVTLFDGLGLAVGTTVVGLIVAIIAMVFSSFLKHVLIKNLNQIEKKAVELSSLITTKEI